VRTVTKGTALNALNRAQLYELTHSPGGCHIDRGHCPDRSERSPHSATACAYGTFHPARDEVGIPPFRGGIVYEET
jgi:hypothetical protein